MVANGLVSAWTKGTFSKASYTTIIDSPVWYGEKSIHPPLTLLVGGKPVRDVYVADSHSWLAGVLLVVAVGFVENSSCGYFGFTSMNSNCDFGNKKYWNVSLHAAQWIYLLSVCSVCCKVLGPVLLFKSVWNKLRIYVYGEQRQQSRMCSKRSETFSPFWFFTVLSCHCCNPESKLTTAAVHYEGWDNHLTAIFRG